MKKVLVLAIVLSLCLVASNVFAQVCSTIGAKDCRVTNPGKCHWWVCDGKAKQWIFTGQSCTCPSRRSNLDSEFPGFMLAQKQYLCQDPQNLEKIKNSIKICIPEARTQDPQLTAFVNPDTCNISYREGTNPDTFWAAIDVFKACMKQNGISISDQPNR